MTGYTSSMELTRIEKIKADNVRIEKIQTMRIPLRPIHVGAAGYACPNCCRFVGIDVSGKANVYFYKQCLCGQLLDWEGTEYWNESVELTKVGEHE